MKCVQMINYGLTDSLSFHEIPMPEITGKDLLVCVHAVGINPIDLKFIKGRYINDSEQQMPVVIGGDFSGEIVAVGERVSIFRKGMQVYGNGFAFGGGSGSLAQYLKVNEERVALKPENLNYESAAAVVTPGCTAHLAVNKILDVKPSEKILITGAGGAIGWHAVQLCVNIGAEVAVTVNQNDIPIMKELGADLMINAQKQAFENIIHDYDAVFDIQGGNVLERCYKALKPEGRIVSLTEKPDPDQLKYHNIGGIQLIPEINTRALDTLRFLFEENILSPCIPQIVPFSQSIKAIEEKISKNNKHKIVIQITN